MQNEILTIRTLDCDVCGRFDTQDFSLSEIRARCQSTDLEIGAYTIPHKDHIRIIYFDNDGNYLGDTIATSSGEAQMIAFQENIPYYIVNHQESGFFSRLRKFVFTKLHNKNLTITIAGPSRAGKTSLVKYLQTLIPERESFRHDSVPTMGKSTKHIKIGKTSVTSLDLGGQEDFWDLWDEPIHNSNAVIFLIDATSENLMEVAKAFEKVVTLRKTNIPVLVVLNKKDLVLRGHAKKFHDTGNFLALTDLVFPIPNVVSIEASVFEGIAYSTTSFEETPLAQVISSFVDDYC